MILPADTTRLRTRAPAASFREKPIAFLARLVYIIWTREELRAVMAYRIDRTLLGLLLPLLLGETS